MTSRKISLDGTHTQIIDLNQDLTDFVVEFTITPREADMEKPYDIAITTQEKLDSGVKPKLTQTNGVFSKTIKNTTGAYQNYCLMISSTTELKDITITIKLTELETPKPEVQAPAPKKMLAPPPLPPSPPYQSPPSPTPTPQHLTKEDTGKKIKIIAGVLILIIGGCALYYFWNKSKISKLEPVELTGSSQTPSVQDVPVVTAPAPAPAPAPAQVPSSGPAFSFY